MGQSQSGASIPAGTGEVKIQQVEKTPDIEQPIPKKKQQEEDLELLKKPKGAEVSEWACDFLFSGTKVTPHRVFVKGRFTLRVKISCARFARAVFLPFALDKYSVLRWQVFRKKKNIGDDAI